MSENTKLNFLNTGNLQMIMDWLGISSIDEMEIVSNQLSNLIAYTKYGYSKDERSMRILLEAFGYAFDLNYKEPQYIEKGKYSVPDAICNGLRSIGVHGKVVEYYRYLAHNRNKRNAELWYALKGKESEYIESMKDTYAHNVSESYNTSIINAFEFAFDSDKEYHENMNNLIGGCSNATEYYASMMEHAGVPNEIIEGFKKWANKFYEDKGEY